MIDLHSQHGILLMSLQGCITMYVYSNFKYYLYTVHIIRWLNTNSGIVYMNSPKHNPNFQSDNLFLPKAFPFVKIKKCK